MVLDPGLNDCEALQYVTAVRVHVGKAALYYGWLCGVPVTQVGRVGPIVSGSYPTHLCNCKGFRCITVLGMVVDGTGP